MAACQVEAINGANNVRGYLLRDPKGRPLRRILDTNGDGRVDMVELLLGRCRSLPWKWIPPSPGKGRQSISLAQRRWFEMEGVDLNKDGKI